MSFNKIPWFNNLFSFEYVFTVNLMTLQAYTLQHEATAWKKGDEWQSCVSFLWWLHHSLSLSLLSGHYLVSNKMYTKLYNFFVLSSDNPVWRLFTHENWTSAYRLLLSLILSIEVHRPYRRTPISKMQQACNSEIPFMTATHQIITFLPTNRSGA